MKTRNKIIMGSAAAAIFAGSYFLLKKDDKYPPLETAKNVDLKKYTGKWYEVARLPFREESGCRNTFAEYSLNDDGTIKVYNKCLKSDGEMEDVEGKAEVVDKTTNSKLKVTFFWPFSGDYWILYVDENYQHALVGTPSREYLWLLSRTPQMNDVVKNQLVGIAQSSGFDTTKLIYTKHD
ncbi:MAG: lipocalin family protein [Bacteroidota bacterium]